MWVESCARVGLEKFFGILPHSTTLRVRMTAKTDNENAIGGPFDKLRASSE
jgi:hypothetical protein